MLPEHLHPDLAGFIETVRLGTVSDAARELGISQPALSARIARLATATGAPVFTREGRRLRLTAHGARVHDGALRVLRSCEAMIAQCRGTEGAAAPLRVGTADAVPKLVVRRILAPYIRADVPVQCREWSAEHLESEIRSHRLDMLITDREPIALRSDDLETNVEGKSAIVLCTRKSLAPVARRNFPEALAHLPLALPAPPSPLRERIDRWLRRHARHARVMIEAEDRSLLHHFAQTEDCLIPVAKATAPLVERQFDLVRVGELAGVEETYYSVRSRWRVPDLG
ncbi:MAG: Transcriptional activator protein NhaR [Planctomycetota bacterium]|jgi:LysR family transcriptional activator of nhaA